MDARTDQITLSMSASHSAKKMVPTLVNKELANFLTLTLDRGAIDLEECEWSLLATAEQLKKILAAKGIHWKIPLIEHWIRKIPLPDKRSGTKKCTLMLRLHDKLTWTDYENAIKASLKIRKDFWVVRTRFETLRSNACLSLVIRGAHSQIDESLQQMKQYALNQGMEITQDYFVVFQNDAELVAEKDLLTTILLPLNR